MPPTRKPPPIGKTFSNWTVISDSNKPGYWTCRCVCGIIKDVRNDGLQNGTSTNCGCIKRLNWIKRNTKYWNNEINDEPFYRRWQEMRNRCYSGRYPIYQEKGIIVCDRWMDQQNGFINFKDDMYESYIDHIKEYGLNETTLERIDNDDNYSPENCKWATRKEQAHNSDRWKNNE